MLRHQENLYKTLNITYHGKYTPYPMLSYGPYDCPLCPVKGLYHEMRSIVIACSGGDFEMALLVPELAHLIKVDDGFEESVIDRSRW